MICDIRTFERSWKKCRPKQIRQNFFFIFFNVSITRIRMMNSLLQIKKKMFWLYYVPWIKHIDYFLFQKVNLRNIWTFITQDNKMCSDFCTIKSIITLWICLQGKIIIRLILNDVNKNIVFVKLLSIRQKIPCAVGSNAVFTLINTFTCFLFHLINVGFSSI